MEEVANNSRNWQTGLTDFDSEVRMVALLDENKPTTGTTKMAA